MSEHNDGAPAFPGTLFDYFAGQALAGLIANGGITGNVYDEAPNVAAMADVIASKMIARRDVRRDPLPSNTAETQVCGEEYYHHALHECTLPADHVSVHEGPPVAGNAASPNRTPSRNHTPRLF